MQFYKLLFLILFFKSTLFSQAIFHNQKFRIGFIPVYIRTENEKMKKEYQYLSTGILKIFLSFLRDHLYIPTKKRIPEIYLQTEKNKETNFSPQYRVTYNILLEKLIPVDPNTEIIYEKLKQIAIEHQIDGLFYGVITLSEQNAEIKFFYKNMEQISYDIFESHFSITLDEPYNEQNQKQIQKSAMDFQNFLLRNNPVKIQILSKEKDYYIFVNEISYGKNLKDILLPDGSFELQVSSENCTERYRINKSVNINFECKSQELVEYQIDCIQKDCDIFIDEKFAGKTPLSVKLPKKVLRIRIYKENFKEKNIITEIQDQKVLLANLNPQKHQKKIKLNSYDISLGLGIQSLILGGLWAYAQTEKERKLDKLISYSFPASLLSINRLTEYSVYQFYQLEQVRNKSLYWHRQSQIYGGLGILSLVGSIYFLYKGISIDLENSYEFSYAELKLFYKYSF